MQVLSRIVLYAIFTSSFLDLAGPPRAEADSCPCTSNSPIVNPFPYRSLRWGTSRVLRGTKGPRGCSTEKKDAHIAIAQVDDGSPVRGFQLVVVDAADGNKQICSGTQLAGVIFNHLFTESDEPVVIRQVALAKVTPDIPGAQTCVLEEYRIVYLIASVHRPDDSVCTHDLHNGKLHRGYRKLSGFGLLDLPAPEPSSKLTDLPLVFPDQLENYVVVMPNADYDSDGEPQTPPAHSNLPTVPFPALEWYELACGGGALAHTDLDGLVEVGEPKEVRTAALRMLRANYRGNRTETLEGVPISFQRDKPHTEKYKALCEMSLPARTPQPKGDSGEKITTIEDKDVEARWAATGAVCASKSRLWMTDGVVTAAQRYPHNMPLKDSERAFLEEIKNRPPAHEDGQPEITKLDVPCKSTSQYSNPSVWFTSGVLHHIKDRR